jgi:hypothetical protein
VAFYTFFFSWGIIFLRCDGLATESKNKRKKRHNFILAFEKKKVKYFPHFERGARIGSFHQRYHFSVIIKKTLALIFFFPHESYFFLHHRTAKIEDFASFLDRPKETMQAEFADPDFMSIMNEIDSFRNIKYHPKPSHSKSHEEDIFDEPESKHHKHGSHGKEHKSRGKSSKSHSHSYHR